MLQNHFHVILSDLSLDAPGRPWTPLDAPGRPWTPLDAPGRPWTPLYLNIIFLNVHKIFTPPPSQKVLQNNFQVILSDLSLDAPVRPYAPVSKRVLLDEPGRRGVSPPPPK